MANSPAARPCRPHGQEAVLGVRARPQPRRRSRRGRGGVSGMQLHSEGGGGLVVRPVLDVAAPTVLPLARGPEEREGNVNNGIFNWINGAAGEHFSASAIDHGRYFVVSVQKPR